MKKIIILGIIFVVIVFWGFNFNQKKSDKELWCIKNPHVRECDPTKINTIGWEDSPFITPDGKELQFMYISWQLYPEFTGKKAYRTGLLRPGHKENPSNFYAETSGWYSSKKNPDGTWSAPIRLFDGCCAMTQDGKTFYFQKEIKSGNNDIFYITRKANGIWSEPFNMGTAVNSDSVEDNPHMTRDGKAIYFTSNRPGGFGGNDLWYSIKQQDGTWLAAQNMGPNINSEEDEDQIWVSPDGRRVYYNTRVELVMSELKDGAWTLRRKLKFPEPVLAAEPSLPDDEQTLYFMQIKGEWNDAKIVYSKLQTDGSWSMSVPVD